MVTTQELVDGLIPFLERKIREEWQTCVIEDTYSNDYSDELKEKVTENKRIIFRRYGRFRPDLTGYMMLRERPGYKPAFLTADVNPGNFSLRKIYKAKLKADLFKASYAFYFTPRASIPRWLKRLHESTNFLRLSRRLEGTFDNRYYIILGCWDPIQNRIREWYPEPYGFYPE